MQHDFWRDMSPKNEFAQSAINAIKQSDARFHAIFDNTAVGIVLMSLERRPIAFNTVAEKIIGYSLHEVQHIDARTLAIPEDRSADDQLFQDLVQGNREAYLMERRYRHKSGRIFWARINYSLVRDLEGKPDYLIGIVEDIDDQKRAAERLAAQEAEYRQTLEQSVEERTRKLAEANERLTKEIEERRIIEDQLAKKAAQEAVTIERTRLARDLHDAVTQTLFSSSLIAEVLPDLWEMDIEEAQKSTEELRQLTRGALAEMRTLLLELRPAALTQTCLSDLLRQLCEAFNSRSRLPINLNIDGDSKLPPEVQVAFYRIAQESLNNAFKYARAKQVNVNLLLSSSGAKFDVSDNGIGFDTSIIKPTSLGMRIMRERAEAIGADLHISSTPGSGTCVELIWNQNPNLRVHVP
jgi:PAS domain S-box-containing protein